MAEAAPATEATDAPARRLRIAIAGIGQGGGGMLPAMASMPQLQLVAGADINPLTRQRFQDRYPETRAYASVAELCTDPDVEAVWVSSPNRFHCEHAVEALRHGKHVVVEKPMATSLAEAAQMIDAAKAGGVILIAGHTNSFELPVRAMRKVVTSGRLGRLRAVHVWSYTDWMLRARTADELDPNQGGGIPWRQGPHQIDVVRLIGGGLLKSIRGTTGDWFRERRVAGYYSAFLEFADGVTATILHDGYGYFSTAELFPWALARRRYSDAELVQIRKEIRSEARNEEAEKQVFRIGGARDPNGGAGARAARDQSWGPGDLGMVLVTCERGDIRNSRYGLYLYSDEGRSEIRLAGAWGAATLEACIAMLQSSREQREIPLERQVAMPADYDTELDLPPEQPVAMDAADA